MATSIGSLVLILAMSTTGGGKHVRSAPNVLPPGPGLGWGYANGQPDGYGFFDPGVRMPLGGDRIPEYYFPRNFAVPADQMFFPTYYNCYVMRGQKYIPYTGAGGCHPMGPPQPPSLTPVHPYQETLGSTPRTPVPTFGGRVEAPPVNTGATGLRP